VAVGTLLPYVMEFNLPASHQRFAMLARSMGETETQKPIGNLASLAISAVKELFSDLGFPKKYSDSVIDPNAIPQIVKMMMGGLYGQYDPNREYPTDTIVPSANIRKSTMKDVIELYEKAFKGW
jgi:alcohol dehydrogenase class IV